MARLHDAVAIVTGSCSGIGLASAWALARAGARVVIHSLHAADADAAAAALVAEGLQAIAVGADLAAPASSASVIADAARSRWGRIDVVVSNAGAILHKPSAELTVKEWSTVFAVNVFAPFFLVRECLPELTASRGSVIMISSTNALVVNRDNMVYDSSKAALNHMSLALALELRDRGIRVNTLMPGGTDTPSVHRWARDVAGDAGERLVRDAAASGSLADSRSIAEGVLMLASGSAPWITGAAIPIDGGFRLG